MTTSVSHEEVSVAVIDAGEPVAPIAVPQVQSRGVYRIRHTLASRFAFLVICIAIVASALAYGTVHYWALALFNLGALAILALWLVDSFQLGFLRINRNALQLPLLGGIVLGIVQLLPVHSGGLINTLSRDPNSTKLVIVQLGSLLVYFAATLVFVDTPHRLHVLVRTIMIFGFLLAIFGLTQNFTSPTKVYWMRELNQSTAFGPFINRHHFAGYMELTISVPLGLLLAGSIDKEKRLLYLFLAGMMGVALVMTASRGGIISVIAEVVFLVIVTAIWRKHGERRRTSRLKSVAARAALAGSLLFGLFLGVVLLGGEFSLNRFIDSVNTDDPTTGRAHFWSVTVDMIKANPIAGTGLGAYGVIYTRYDSRNGLFRLEQAHNDYLQVFSDAGVVGGVLAFAFVVMLFYRGFKRAKSRDDFRRGVALAALGGCFAVLIHSFFDFTLHTTSNALLFLVLAALATMNGRVEDAPPRRRRKKTAEAET